MRSRVPYIWLLFGLCAWAITMTSCSGDGEGLTEAGDPIGTDETVVIPASKDNTLYESATGALSNGSGAYVFVGRTRQAAGASLRRAIVAFDVAGHVPAGATIVGVEVRLNLSRKPAAGGVPARVDLHRVLASWGEGTSDAPQAEGSGAASTTGDVTWVHTFFNTDNWTTPGGDFVQTASAGGPVDDVGAYGFAAPGMITDVQMWLDTPSDNHGWILIGNETDNQSARRFNSRENPNTSTRPQLVVIYRRSP